MVKKFLLLITLGFSFQTLLPVRIQTGHSAMVQDPETQQDRLVFVVDGDPFVLNEFQKNTLNSLLINIDRTGFADACDDLRVDVDYNTFKLLLELIGADGMFNVERAKEILRNVNPVEFLPLIGACDYLIVKNAKLLEVVAEHYFAIQSTISWADFSRYAREIAAFFTAEPANNMLLAQAMPLVATCQHWLQQSFLAILYGNWLYLTDVNGNVANTTPTSNDSYEAVAWSPDGTMLAAGSADHTIKLWKTSTGAHIRTFMGHSSFVSGVAWSPDGKRLATWSSDGTVKIWLVQTGACIHTLEGVEWRRGVGACSLQWSDDGIELKATFYLRHGFLATAIIEKRWQSVTGLCVGILERESTLGEVAVDFRQKEKDSPDHRWRAVADHTHGYRSAIMVCTRQPHECAQELGISGYDEQMINDFAWSPDSKKLAVASWYIVKVWDLTGGLSLFQQLFMLRAGRVIFTPGNDAFLDDLYRSLPYEMQDKIDAIAGRKQRCCIQ